MIGRHVVRLPAWPRALPPRRRYFNFTPTQSVGRRAASTDTDSAQLERLRGKEEDQQLLRDADLQELRETRMMVKDLVAKTLAAKAHVDSIPTKVQVLPDIPPYQLGPIRASRSDFDAAVTETIKSAERVLQQLKDLQYEPYKTKGEYPMDQFEREIERLSVDDKEHMFTEMKNKEVAMQTRSNTEAMAYMQDIKRAREQYGTVARKIPNPFDPLTVNESAVEEVEHELDAIDAGSVESGWQLQPRERIEKKPPPDQQDLISMQAQLFATINTKK